MGGSHTEGQLLFSYELVAYIWSSISSLCATERTEQRSTSWRRTWVINRGLTGLMTNATIYETHRMASATFVEWRGLMRRKSGSHHLYDCDVT